MQNHHESKRLAVGLTVLSALGRLAPHAPNVTPLGGSCLFAGSRIPGWLAYLVPIVVMAATDPLVGGFHMASFGIYLAFLVNVWIGRRLVRKVTPARVGAAAFLCSLQFFLISNFAVWLAGDATPVPYYAANLQGLMACYAAAIPFWYRTLAGDLVFSGALFAMYELLRSRFAVESSATVS